MRFHHTLLLTGLILTACSNEPEQTKQIPAPDKETNAAESPPANLPSETATSSLYTDEPAVEPSKPLNLSLTSEDLLEHWTWDDDYNWDAGHLNNNLFEEHNLFRQEEDSSRVFISIIPRFDVEEDLTELEFDGGEINIKVKTE